MSGILRLESLTKGNTLKQGDKTPLKYRLFDADGEKLNIAGKSAKVRLVYPDFLTIGYEKDGLTVAQDDTVTFTIDSVIPSRIYHVEIIVDGKFIFPSRADESKFTVDKSSLGTEANIIEIVGKDVLIQAVKSQVDTELQPLVTSLESAQQAETQRVSAESSRVSAEEQRKIDHANRSAELAGKADKVVIKNLIENGDFSDGRQGWYHGGSIKNLTFNDNYVEFEGSGQPMISSANWVSQPPSVTPDEHDTVYVRALVTRISGEGVVQLGSGYSTARGSIPLNVKTLVSYRGVPSFTPHGNTRYVVLSADTGVTARFESVVYLNLTKTFGAGNEPTKEEMDELIKVTGYIDREYALNNKEMLGYLLNGIGGKANKKQEDWITPTLTNGATGSIQFRKNQFGRVEFRGKLTGTEGVTVFRLPTGYQPRETFRTLAKHDTSGTETRTIQIQRGGAVYLEQPYGTYEVYFDTISFNAE